LAQLVDDVARAPDRITDEQFEALYTAGYSAEVLCELALAAALGAGVERRTTGMEAIDAWESGFTDPRGAAR
jgi:alkylhydroperoxidase family enzyme